MKISEDQVVNMARTCAQNINLTLNIHYGIPTNMALEIAKDAGDALAQRLVVLLKDRGVEVVPRLKAA